MRRENLHENSIENCPILRPSEEEFSSFLTYMEKVEAEYEDKFGMVKIVPPSSWRPSSSEISELTKQFKIRSPILQQAVKRDEVYQLKFLREESMTYENYVRKNADNNQGLSEEEIERKFWHGIMNSAACYGSDILKTWMDKSAGSWFLDDLQSILTKAIPERIQGINCSHCYLGSWRSLFCWHKEDLDLSAINFLHSGAPKFWYCLARSSDHHLEKRIKRKVPEHFEKCPEAMRHKTFLINPNILKKEQKDIKISKAVQKEGEFIVAFGGAYHCGFNSGLNIAEAVNYATLNWLQKFMKAQSCPCKPWSVKADHEFILEQLEKYQEVRLDQRFIKAKESLQKMKKTKKIKKQFSEKNKKKKQKKQKKQKKKELSAKELKTEQSQQEYFAQCDLCQKWRLISESMNSEIQEGKFFCQDIDINCEESEEIFSEGEKLNHMVQFKEEE